MSEAKASFHGKALPVNDFVDRLVPQQKDEFNAKKAQAALIIEGPRLPPEQKVIDKKIEELQQRFQGKNIRPEVLNRIATIEALKDFIQLPDKEKKTSPMKDLAGDLKAETGLSEDGLIFYQILQGLEADIVSTYNKEAETSRTALPHKPERPEGKAAQMARIQRRLQNVMAVGEDLTSRKHLEEFTLEDGTQIKGRTKIFVDNKEFLHEEYRSDYQVYATLKRALMPAEYAITMQALKDGSAKNIDFSQSDLKVRIGLTDQEAAQIQAHPTAVELSHIFDQKMARIMSATSSAFLTTPEDKALYEKLFGSYVNGTFKKGKLQEIFGHKNAEGQRDGYEGFAVDEKLMVIDQNPGEHSEIFDLLKITDELQQKTILSEIGSADKRSIVNTKVRLHGGKRTIAGREQKREVIEDLGSSELILRAYKILDNILARSQGKPQEPGPEGGWDTIDMEIKIPIEPFFSQPRGEKITHLEPSAQPTLSKPAEKPVQKEPVTTAEAGVTVPEETLSPEQKELRMKQACIASLQASLPVLKEWLTTAIAEVKVPEFTDEDQKSFVENEQWKREGQIKTLNNPITIIPAVLSNFDETLKGFTEAEKKPSDYWIENAYSEKVFFPILKTHILSELSRCWRDQKSLERFETNLTEEQRQQPDVKKWLDVRHNLWRQWQEALDKAGLELIIPVEGEDIEKNISNIEIESSDEGYDRTRPHIIKSVTAPGLRFKDRSITYVIAFPKVVMGNPSEETARSAVDSTSVAVAEAGVAVPEKILSPEVQNYQRHYRCMTSLIGSFEELQQKLTTALAECPAPGLTDEFVDNENWRREQIPYLFRNGLQGGKVYLNRATGIEEKKADELSRGIPVKMAEEHAVDAFFSTITYPYVSKNVAGMTNQLWENLQSFNQFEASLTDEQRNRPEVQKWLQLRKDLWQWWQEAIDKAGLELVIPEEHSPCDMDAMKKDPVLEIDERSTEIAHEKSAEIVSVTTPGIRWKASDSLRQTYFVLPKVVIGNPSEDTASNGGYVLSDSGVSTGSQPPVVESAVVGQAIKAEPVVEVLAAVQTQPPVRTEPATTDEALAVGSAPHESAVAEKTIPVYTGAQDKMKVLNEGHDGREYAVPFKLRLGDQHLQLPLSIDPKDPTRIIILPDVNKEETRSAFVLKEKGTKLFLKIGEKGRKHDILLNNLAENPFVIALNEETAVEVRSFNPETREIILHKIKGSKELWDQQKTPNIPSPLEPAIPPSGPTGEGELPAADLTPPIEPTKTFTDDAEVSLEEQEIIRRLHREYDVPPQAVAPASAPFSLPSEEIPSYDRSAQHEEILPQSDEENEKLRRDITAMGINAEAHAGVTIPPAIDIPARPAAPTHEENVIDALRRETGQIGQPSAGEAEVPPFIQAHTAERAAADAEFQELLAKLNTNETPLPLEPGAVRGGPPQQLETAKAAAESGVAVPAEERAEVIEINQILEGQTHKLLGHEKANVFSVKGTLTLTDSSSANVATLEPSGEVNLDNKAQLKLINNHRGKIRALMRAGIGVMRNVGNIHTSSRSTALIRRNELEGKILSDNNAITHVANNTGQIFCRGTSQTYVDILDPNLPIHYIQVFDDALFFSGNPINPETNINSDASQIFTLASKLPQTEEVLEGETSFNQKHAGRHRVVNIDGRTFVISRAKNDLDKRGYAVFELRENPVSDKGPKTLIFTGGGKTPDDIAERVGIDFQQAIKELEANIPVPPKPAEQSLSTADSGVIAPENDSNQPEVIQELPADSFRKFTGEGQASIIVNIGYLTAADHCKLSIVENQGSLFSEDRSHNLVLHNTAKGAIHATDQSATHVAHQRGYVQCGGESSIYSVHSNGSYRIGVSRRVNTEGGNYRLQSDACIFLHESPLPDQINNRSTTDQIFILPIFPQASELEGPSKVFNAAHTAQHQKIIDIGGHRFFIVNGLNSANEVAWAVFEYKEAPVSIDKPKEKSLIFVDGRMAGDDTLTTRLREKTGIADFPDIQTIFSQTEAPSTVSIPPADPTLARPSVISRTTATVKKRLSGLAGIRELLKRRAQPAGSEESDEAVVEAVFGRAQPIEITRTMDEQILLEKDPKNFNDVETLIKLRTPGMGLTEAKINGMIMAFGNSSQKSGLSEGRSASIISDMLIEWPRLSTNGFPPNHEREESVYQYLQKLKEFWPKTMNENTRKIIISVLFNFFAEPVIQQRYSGAYEFMTKIGKKDKKYKPAQKTPFIDLQLMSNIICDLDLHVIPVNSQNT